MPCRAAARSYREALPRSPLAVWPMRQVDGAATGRDDGFRPEERRGIPGTDRIETGLAQDAADLLGRPANFLHALVVAAPKATFANEAINVGNGALAIAAVGIAHHHEDTRRFKADGAVPVALEAKPVVHIEEEVSARAKGAESRLDDAAQIGTFGDVVECIPLAHDQVNRFGQAEASHIGLEDMQR